MRSEHLVVTFTCDGNVDYEPVTKVRSEVRKQDSPVTLLAHASARCSCVTPGFTVRDVGALPTFVVAPSGYGVSPFRYTHA